MSFYPVADDLDMNQTMSYATPTPTGVAHLNEPEPLETAENFIPIEWLMASMPDSYGYEFNLHNGTEGYIESFRQVSQTSSIECVFNPYPLVNKVRYMQRAAQPSSRLTSSPVLSSPWNKLGARAKPGWLQVPRTTTMLPRPRTNTSHVSQILASVLIFLSLYMT
jgi:hypothetical protein